MDLEVETKQPKFYNYITKALNKGFLSHAYLIESNNNCLEIIKKYINFFVKKIYQEYYKNADISISLDKLLYLIDKNEFPDFIEISPVNNQIKKEQLLFIRDDFSNKSLYNTKKIYVVYCCEKMNSSSSNAILKFLEEPADDVIAIFVTSNQYNILDTIRSRCQILSLLYETNDDVVFSSKILEFIDDISKRDKDNLLLKFNCYSGLLFKDRQHAELTLKDIIKYYEMLLNQSSDVDNIEDVIYIISILQDSLKKLKYNVNVKLWLDNLLLSLMEV